MKKNEHFIVMTIISIFLMGLLGETYFVRFIPESLIIKNYELTELTMIIFQVHATISTLGIAIVTIVSGTNTNSIYGIPVSNYILYIKPKLLKHLRVIIFILLSILVAYFLSVFGHYNLLISVFIITIILLSNLIYDVSIVFNGNKYMEYEISSYIMEEYQNIDVIALLTRDLIDSVDKSDTIRYQANMTKLCEVFQKVVKENFKKFIKESTIERIKKKLRNFFTKDITPSEKDDTIASPKNTCDMQSFWENELSQIFNHSFINLKSSNLNYAFEFLNKFYHNLNSNKNYDFRLWNDIYLDYFNALNNISNISEVKINIFIELRYHLYNIITHNKSINSIYYIDTFTSKIYYTYLSKSNSNENKSTIEKCKIYLFDTIKKDCDFTYYIDDQTKLNLLNSELRHYTKNLIDNCENNVLNKTFSKILSDRLFSQQNKNIYLSLLSIIVYIFYISENEPLVTEELKKSSSKFISDNKNSISSFLYDFDIRIITRVNVELIFSYIENWEFVPDEDFVVKSMVLGKYINSFLIYLFLYTQRDSTVLKNALENIVGKSSFSFVSSYTRQNNPDSIKDYLFIVRTLFNPHISNEDVENDFYRLENLLFDIYRQDEFTKGYNQKLREENKKELEGKITSTLQKSISDKINLFDSIDFKSNYKESEFEFKINTFTSFIASGIHNDIEIVLTPFFYHLFTDMITDKKLIFENVSYRDKQALVKLFNCTHSLGFDVDTIIGYRDWFYDYEKVEDFNKLLENVTKIKFPSTNNIILLNKSNFSLKDLKCSVKIEDIDFDEFIKTLEINEDGRYLYNITNDIFLPFEKYELREHIKNTRKFIKCVIKYKYAYKGNKIGAGIIFDGQF